MPVGWTWTSNGMMWAPGKRHFGADQLENAKRHYVSEGGLHPEFQSAIRLIDMRKGGTLDIWETEAIAGVERFVPISQNPDLKDWLVMLADVPNSFGGTNDPKNRFWHYLSPDNLWFDPMDTDGIERHVAELKILTPMEPPPPSKPEEVPPQTIVEAACSRSFLRVNNMSTQSSSRNSPTYSRRIGWFIRSRSPNTGRR